MKQQTLKSKLDDVNSFATSLNNILEENYRLQRDLHDATNKQHQEMSRAIELKEKNLKLKKLIHETKLKACRIKESNRKL